MPYLQYITIGITPARGAQARTALLLLGSCVTASTMRSPRACRRQAAEQAARELRAAVAAGNQAQRPGSARKPDSAGSQAWRPGSARSPQSAMRQEGGCALAGSGSAGELDGDHPAALTLAERCRDLAVRAAVRRQAAARAAEAASWARHVALDEQVRPAPSPRLFSDVAGYTSRSLLCRRRHWDTLGACSVDPRFWACMHASWLVKPYQRTKAGAPRLLLQRREAAERTAEHTARTRAAAAAAAGRVAAARAEARRRRAFRARADAARLAAAAAAAVAAREARSERRRLAAAAAAASAAERQAARCARRAQLARCGRERVAAVARNIAIVKRALAEGQACRPPFYKEFVDMHEAVKQAAQAPQLPCFLAKHGEAAWEPGCRAAQRNSCCKPQPHLAPLLLVHMFAGPNAGRRPSQT